jgi:hypothetical protein
MASAKYPEPSRTGEWIGIVVRQLSGICVISVTCVIRGCSPMLSDAKRCGLKPSAMTQRGRAMTQNARAMTHMGSLASSPHSGFPRTLTQMTVMTQTPDNSGSPV